MVNGDRMCSSAPRNLSHPKVAQVMREVDRVVVSLSPEIYPPTKDNCEGTIVSPLAVSEGGISHVFVLNTSSEVFEIRLHYPAQPKIIASSKEPLRDIQYSGGILFAVSAKQLMYKDRSNVLKPPLNYIRTAQAKEIMQKYRLAPAPNIPHLHLNDMKRMMKKSMRKQLARLGSVKSKA